MVAAPLPETISVPLLVMATPSKFPMTEAEEAMEREATTLNHIGIVASEGLHRRLLPKMLLWGLREQSYGAEQYHRSTSGAAQARPPHRARA